jgi:hypothetical protein
LVTALDAPEATVTFRVIVAVAPIAMAVLLVQATIGGADVQLNPSGDEKPTKVTNAGSSSSTRIVPLLGCEPLLGMSWV